MLKDLVEGAASTDTDWFRKAGDFIYLQSGEFPTGGIWRTDGTAQGTTNVLDFHNVRAKLPNSACVPMWGGAFSANDNVYMAFYDWSALPDGLAVYQLWHVKGHEEQAHLVKWIEGAPTNSASTLQAVALGNRLCFFTGNFIENTHALWISDGTEAGTSCVCTLNGYDYSGRYDLVSNGTTALFAGEGGSIWRTDGTQKGTKALVDSEQPPVYWGWYASGSRFFLLREQPTGCDLYGSDGTAQGTSLLAALSYYSKTKSGGANLHPIIPFGNRWLLPWPTSSGNGGYDVQLWLTDGTSSGTSRTTTIPLSSYPYTPYSVFDPYVVAGGVCYGVVDDDGSYATLWRTDGTEAGTYALAKCAKTYANDYPVFNMAALGNQLVFSCSAVGDDPWEPGEFGEELYCTDGTIEGTRLVKDINAGLAGSSPFPLGVLNAVLVFSATDPVFGRELWVTDGTQAGTHLLKDIRPGTEDAQPSGMTAFHDQVFMAATDAQHGEELWRTDGTAAGTGFVKDCAPGSQGSGPQGFAVVGDRLCFVTPNGIGGGLPLWSSDGSEEGTLDIKRLSTTSSGGAYRVASAGAFGYVTATNAVWRTDGTADGTFQRTPAPGSIYNDSMLLVGDTGLFVSGGDLYSVRDTIMSLHSGSCRNSLCLLGNQAYFTTWPSGDTPAGLWKTDGASIAQLISYIGNPSGTSFKMAQAGSYLYFLGEDATHGTELWQSDGTAAGTLMVADIRPGPESSEPTDFTDFNGKLYFVADDGVHGAEVWRTDGTAGGTQLLRDIYPGATGSGASHLVVYNDRLYLHANDGIHGAEEWISDGTSPGTVLFRDIWPGPNGSPVGECRVTGGRLWIAADDGVHGMELWVTDGDSDHDGIGDGVEGTGDADNDGIPNYLDPDSDGDAIPDAVETDADADHDGTANFLDLDSDGDGIPDAVEGIRDADNDGTPDFLEVDSDNDGILDIVETTADADGDGIPNYRDTDSDADGVPDWQERIFGSDPYNPNSTVAVPVGGTGAVILAISLLGALLCRKRR